MATLRLFAAAREAAGTSVITLTGKTANAVIAAATEQFGAEFARIVPYCTVMVDGETTADPSAVVVGDESEIALLPPFSGGCA